MRSAEEFEEEEYTDSMAVLADTSAKLAAGCTTGWYYPWPLRVRVCETLLRGKIFVWDLQLMNADSVCPADSCLCCSSVTMRCDSRYVCRYAAMFDTLDESTYIDEHVQLGLFLEQTVWPLLGISSMLHLAINVWVHFR